MHSTAQDRQGYAIFAQGARTRRQRVFFSSAGSKKRLRDGLVLVGAVLGGCSQIESELPCGRYVFALFQQRTSACPWSVCTHGKYARDT